MQLADLAQSGRPSRNTRKLHVPSGEGFATAISDWAKLLKQTPCRTLPRRTSLGASVVFYGRLLSLLLILHISRAPNTQKNAHNSTVSSESVDAPTLACRKGTISDHGPPPLRASNFPLASESAIFTPTNRGAESERVSTIGPVSSATANGRGVYESFS